MNAIPNGGRLDATAIRRLLSSLSSHLRRARSFNHHLMVVGGAALALMWEDRSTFDVDVLEHRFKAPPDPVTAERRTGAVDFISMRFPAELDNAASLVAEAEHLPGNWLNGAVAIFTPDCDLDPRVLYRSDCLTVESPSPRVLLAMKLHAGRAKDAQDAARLIRETGISASTQLLALVEDAYGTDAVTADTDRFVGHALSLAVR